MATAVSNRCGLWFGTKERSDWFRTPLSGADSSPQAWGASGTTLNGHGYSLGSWGSHKVYNYEWSGASAREVAQLMKSYADGTYGRGLIYFQDPLTFDTNVLSARLADPSMALGYEGTSLVYGVQPSAAPTGANTNDLPVTSTVYDLAGVTPGFRGEQQAIYVPIPDGYTLFLGAFYSFSGTGGVFASPQNLNGTIGAPVKLSTLANDSTAVVRDKFAGVSGVWIWVGKTSAAASTVTLRAMIGRLLQTSQTVTREVARNLFTNPNLVGDGTWAEVRRNYCSNPSFESGVSGWASGSGAVLRRVTGPNAIVEGSWGAEIEALAGATIATVQLVATFESVSPGDYLSIRQSMRRGTNDVFPEVVMGVNWYDGATFISSTYQPPVAVGTGAASLPENRFEAVFGAAPAGTTRALIVYRWRISGTEPAPAGSVVHMDAVQFGRGASAGQASRQTLDYFDGSTTNRSIDPDMRQRWTGTPNDSESVMEIERARGVNGNNVIAGVSSENGVPVLRLIPTSSSADSYAEIVPAPLVGNREYTIMGTVIMRAPITGTPHSRARRVVRALPIDWSEQAPNVEGDTDIRWVNSSAGTRVLLYHGGVQGSGEVRWGDVGIFEGSYDGSAFSGSDPAGNNLVYSWAGATDNSESIATFVPPQLTKLLRGPWIGGQGNAGCRFEGKPTYIENNGVNGGQIGFAATFREVG